MEVIASQRWRVFETRCTAAAAQDMLKRVTTTRYAQCLAVNSSTLDPHSYTRCRHSSPDSRARCTAGLHGNDDGRGIPRKIPPVWEQTAEIPREWKSILPGSGGGEFMLREIAELVQPSRTGLEIQDIVFA